MFSDHAFPTAPKPPRHRRHHGRRATTAAEATAATTTAATATGAALLGDVDAEGTALEVLAVEVLDRLLRASGLAISTKQNPRD